MMSAASRPASAFTTQLGWVVRDFKKSEALFRRIYGIDKLFVAENIEGKSVATRYFGRPVDCLIHIYVAYAGDAQFEFIQPVSGENIYEDFLKETGSDGIQHIGQLMPIARFDAAVEELRASGFAEMQTMTFEISKVAYFDTRKAIGTVTEIIGLNSQGIEWDRALKANEF
jgi:hypothetical protein